MFPPPLAVKTQCNCLPIAAWPSKHSLWSVFVLHTCSTVCLCLAESGCVGCGWGRGSIV